MSTIPIEVSGDVPQANTCLLYFPLTDYDQTTPVSVDNITSAVMNVFVADSRERIGATDRDVKNSFNQAGIFAHLLSADDNQIISNSEAIEYQKHVAIIKVIATGATHPIVFEREFRIKIINQQHIANVAPA